MWWIMGPRNHFWTKCTSPRAKFWAHPRPINNSWTILHWEWTLEAFFWFIDTDYVIMCAILIQNECWLCYLTACALLHFAWNRASIFFTRFWSMYTEASNRPHTHTYNPFRNVTLCWDKFTTPSYLQVGTGLMTTFRAWIPPRVLPFYKVLV